MEKRYQVFISSTFQDLQNARQEVSQALLRADCFPAGMELFPAADEEQFEFIKTVIDQSDYYIIISAGRYGSIHPETGLSYTEMEYDYAVSVGKPIIRLLHKDPFEELKGAFIERSDSSKNKLLAFREKLLEQSLVQFWRQPSELGRVVAFALRHLNARGVGVGWVRLDRAHRALSEEDKNEILGLADQALTQLMFEEFPSHTLWDAVEAYRVLEKRFCRLYDASPSWFISSEISSFLLLFDNFGVSTVKGSPSSLKNLTARNLAHLGWRQRSLQALGLKDSWEKLHQLAIEEKIVRRARGISVLSSFGKCVLARAFLEEASIIQKY